LKISLSKERIAIVKRGYGNLSFQRETYKTLSLGKRGFAKMEVFPLCMEV
jgi:hypothetical protein